MNVPTSLFQVQGFKVPSSHADAEAHLKLVTSVIHEGTHDKGGR